MSRLEGWGFLCLIGCGLTVALSLSLLTGDWQVAGALTGVALGILSGGLYAASAHTKTSAKTETGARRHGEDS